MQLLKAVRSDLCLRGFRPWNAEAAYHRVQAFSNLPKPVPVLTQPFLDHSDSGGTKPVDRSEFPSRM
jgi:hypothetical protein